LISKGIISFNPFIFKKEISLIHYPIVSKPIIPSFQYSNIPIGAKPLSSGCSYRAGNGWQVEVRNPAFRRRDQMD